MMEILSDAFSFLANHNSKRNQAIAFAIVALFIFVLIMTGAISILAYVLCGAFTAIVYNFWPKKWKNKVMQRIGVLLGGYFIIGVSTGVASIWGLATVGLVFLVFVYVWLKNRGGQKDLKEMIGVGLESGELQVTEQQKKD